MKPNKNEGPIRLVLADVDGTLVTQQKVLTPNARHAVAQLGQAGILFAITSGRSLIFDKSPPPLTMVTHWAISVFPQFLRNGPVFHRSRGLDSRELRLNTRRAIKEMNDYDL
jgi:haloacid dehalogenase-like hydrolase